MKRILHVISTLEQGGTEAVVLNYFNHIDKEKVMFDFLVIWGENKGFHEDYLLSMGCRIFKMHNGPDKFFAHGKELKSFFQNQKYDVVHIHAMSSLRYRVAKVAKKNGVKTVIYHSHNSYNGSHLLIHKLLKGRLNRWCDYKFACSDAAGRYMYNGSFHKINNAIDIEHFSFNEDYRNELRHQYNLEDKFIIGNIGRFTEVKNQQFLLKLSAYIESRIDNYVIFCIGEGEQRENLSNYIKDNKLERNVILSGTVGMEAYKYYNLFDCFAFPSKFEGLSMVVVEAQSNGLPVVASDKISTEHKLCDNFKFLSIEENKKNYDLWAETIKSLGNKRGNTQKVIAEAGYDIRIEAKNLQEFYLSLK